MPVTKYKTPHAKGEKGRPNGAQFDFAPLVVAEIVGRNNGNDFTTL